jgi:type III secretory pathway component EscT
MVAVTVFVAVFITETVLSPLFETYAYCPVVVAFAIEAIKISAATIKRLQAKGLINLFKELAITGPPLLMMKLFVHF